ncbi:MAG TPA: zf-HC2 domain-containing protein [Pedococcus sp.]|jgi:anti-sigma factor RsiW
MSAIDGYAQWDAAYVLGALAPDERADFEQHLATCGRCRGSVAELAGIPGLLSQVPAPEVLAMDIPADDEAVVPPVSLMPALPARRRRWLAPVAAAAAAVLIGGVGGYAVSTATQDSAPTPTVTAAGPRDRLAFSAVEPSSMTAVLDVVPVGRETGLKVECQYAVGSAAPGEPDYQGAWAEYAIWVVDKGGHAQQLKSWTAKPDRVMHPSAVAPVPVGQIRAVEIRRVDSGETVMRASLA